MRRARSARQTHTKTREASPQPADEARTKLVGGWPKTPALRVSSSQEPGSPPRRGTTSTQRGTMPERRARRLAVPRATGPVLAASWRRSSVALPVAMASRRLSAKRSATRRRQAALSHATCDQRELVQTRTRRRIVPLDAAPASRATQSSWIRARDAAPNAMEAAMAASPSMERVYEFFMRPTTDIVDNSKFSNKNMETLLFCAFNRVAAADGSRRRRGCDVYVPWRRHPATPRPRGRSVETGGAARLRQVPQASPRSK